MVRGGCVIPIATRRGSRSDLAALRQRNPRVPSRSYPLQRVLRTGRLEGMTMVQMRDGAVLLTGRVLESAVRLNFESKKPEGMEYTLSAGGGFALLRVSNDEIAAAQAQGIAPLQVDDRIAVLARPSAWSRDGGLGNVAYRLERHATPADLDALAHVMGLDTAERSAA